MSSPEALAARGEAALAEEELANAVALLDAAEAAGAEPDRCAGNRWLAYMLAGDFNAAWRESDAIRQRAVPDPHRFWMGEDLCGKRVMVRSLHGFGDAVQMFRFLPRLQATARQLIVEVPPRLVELAPYFDGMGEVMTWGEQAPAAPPAWDVQVEVMELPYLLRVGTENLLPGAGYLRLPESVRAQASRVVGAGTQRRVGVVWTAGHWNASRSIPFGFIEPFTRVDGLELWNLEARHASGAGAPPGWRDVYECGDGIVALAAVIERMDLVITVDTLAAHLAGALGVPCWLMLQHRADWRWMAGRADSPWYPSLRLWRQSVAGSWAELLGRVADALACWARADHSCSAGELTIRSVSPVAQSL